MEEKKPIAWTAVTHYLKTAALLPKQRDEMISHALRELLTCIPAVGTALIWPCQSRKVPWRVYYVGVKRNTIHRWLSARLDPSFNAMIGVLEHDLTSKLLDMPSPHLLTLNTSLSPFCGLWIIWTVPSSASSTEVPITENVERVRRTLEALLEVENEEEQYFSTSSLVYDRELINALAHGDAYALSALLNLTRIVGKADITFWGKSYQDVVEISAHLGARHSGFGFALPRGHGIGGRVAAYGTPIVRGDYLNSPYRDPIVCDIVDKEQIRVGMALPIRYNIERDKSAHVAAVLYATRRNVTPFSLAERLLMLRLTHHLEPLPFESRPSSFFSPGVQHFPNHKAAWYDLVLHANRIEALETWVGQLIKGVIIVTDSDGHPYVFSNAEQLKQIKVSQSNQPGTVQVISLAAPGVHLPGQIYLCSSTLLPPPQWPDFFVDLVMACNLVIMRVEQQQDQLSRQREQWLRTLLQGKSSPYVEQEGYRLGLPVNHGHVWVLAWPSETMKATKSHRFRTIAESVVLDNLKKPLIFLDDDMAVVLLEEQAPQSPMHVRDALLKNCGADLLWMVYGVRYHSSQDLKTALTHAITIAQKARREGHGEYLLDIYTFGLDSLLDNPKLAEDLDAFARKLFAPLIEHDVTYGSRLTETFVLAQTLGSTQVVADYLGVHVNTIRYRLHRVNEILGKDQTSPKDTIAMALAAFIWKSYHMMKHA